jgi:hypothetical protein
LDRERLVRFRDVEVAHGLSRGEHPGCQSTLLMSSAASAVKKIRAMPDDIARD